LSETEALRHGTSGLAVVCGSWRFIDDSWSRRQIIPDVMAKYSSYHSLILIALSTCEWVRLEYRNDVCFWCTRFQSKAASRKARKQQGGIHKSRQHRDLSLLDWAFRPALC
jgi:hypothetical protein